MMVRGILIISFLFFSSSVFSQQNLLLNGGFEDINTCTEYKSECGVEGWFYLKEVKAQMLLNEANTQLLGSNTFAIYYNWIGYTGFNPIIGTILPCTLQKGNEYIFQGLISASLNPKLILKPAVCTGKYFFVPNRAFSKNLKPDTIVSLKRVPNTAFFEFEYHFTANGDEKYLTFGTYVMEDTIGAKKKLFGTQMITVALDNFQLTPVNKDETYCKAYLFNKTAIYEYDSRHKEMDYSLFGKGELNIELMEHEKDNLTRFEPKLAPIKADTLKLGDVLFDFNKANLKAAAIKVLEDFFTSSNNKNIDSIYIEGHTDSIGTDARNIKLSAARSQSIRTWLVSKNIVNEDRLQVHAFGKSRPVATNKTIQGRAMNRRVELIIFRRRK